MRNLFTAAIAAVAIAAPAAAQQVTTTTVNSSSYGGFNYGAGNNYSPANAVDTRTTTNGVVTGDLATRFHVSGQPASASDANGLYAFALGTNNISFDYSLFGTDTANANITLTNLLTGATASFNPLGILDNNITNGAVSNSEQLGFGFLNGGFSFGLVTGNLGFNSAINNTYRIDLSGGGHIATAFAQVGTGAGAVPEPATWAMMLLGFAGIGIAVRRQRRPQALAQIA